MCKGLGFFLITAGLLFSGLAHAATPCTWHGGGGTPFWTNGANWDTPPSAGDDLIFADSSIQSTATNDFGGGTSFHSISLTDATGFTLNGNSITLTKGASAISSSAGANSVQIAITFSTAAPSIVCSGGTGLTLTSTIANGGFNITFDSTAAITVSGAISGTGGIIETGSGGPALTLSGANLYSGLTTINNNGTLIAANNTALGAAGTGTTVNTGGTLLLDGGVSITEPLTLNGTGSGAGALANLTGSNSYNGNITIATTNTLIGGATLTTLTLSGTMSLGANNVSFVGSGAINSSQVISGTANVTVAGGVTVTLSGVSTYSGNTNVSIGTLVAGASVMSATDGPFGHSASAVQVGSSFNAALEVGGSTTFARPVSVIGSGFALIVLDGSSNLSGAITVTSPSGLAITTNGTPATVSGTIDNGGQPLSFQPLPAQTLTVSGAISGAGPVSCDAPGMLVLSGTNNFTGPVGISAGTLQVGGASAIPGTADVTVAPTGLFDVNSNSTSAASINGTGGISLGSGTLTLSPAAPDMFGGMISGLGGGISLSSGQLTLTAANTYTGSNTVATGAVLTIDGAQSGSVVAVLSGGVLQGTGAVGAVTLTGGGLGVGDPQTNASTFSTGAVNLDAASLVKLNLSGFTAGTNMDQLNCSGAFAGAGTLNLNLMGLAAPGTAASIITYTSPASQFNNVTFSNNTNNYGATLTYNPTHLDIQFSAAIPAPTLSVASDSGTLGDGLTNVNKPTINGTGAGAGATITIMDVVALLGTATADGAGNWSFTCPSPLANGPHGLAASQSQFGGFSAPLLIAIDTVAPTATIAQQAGQADPASISPVKFLVTFSKPVTGFTNADVQLSGTAGATTAAVVTISPTQYEVDVSGITMAGTVIINVAAGAATDAAGNTSVAATITDNTVTYSTVAPTITSQLTACGDQFQPFSYTISATGTAPITFAANGLPSGLSLTGAVISGTPTVYGTFSVTLTASNAATPADSKTLTLTIVPQGISITSPSSAQGKAGVPFNYTFSGTSGAPPVSFTIGTPLPGGLIASGSSISGVPTTAGDFTVPVTATDAANQTFDGSLAISILAKTGNSAPVVDLIITDIPTGDTGDVGTPVDFSVNAVDPEGGRLSFAWTITAGATPAVLGTATASEYLQTFDVAGTYTVRVTVTDVSGTSAFQETTISVTTPAPSAPTLETIVINEPDLSGGGPTVVVSSSKFPKSGEVCILTAKGAAVVTGPLSYVWDFGDGSALSSPSTSTNISHTYATAGDYTVTLDAVDANNVHAAHKLTALVSVFQPSANSDILVVPPAASDFTAADPLVQLPLSTMVTDSGSGRFTLSIQVFSLVSDGQIAHRALTAAERAANEFTTDFGTRGGGVVKGTEPSVHYKDSSLFVATTHMRDRATKMEVSKARITLLVSRADVGLPPVVKAEPKSRVIGVKSLSGNFDFSHTALRDSLAVTAFAGLGARSAASDKVTVSGSFEMPAGLDLSKSQEMQFALGNIVESAVLSPKGTGRSARASFKVTTKSKSGMSEAGQMAKYSITFNAPALSAAGFESEGVVEKPLGKGVVVHGAMLLGGVTYGVEIPTLYGVKAKGTASTGALKLFKPKKK